MAYAVCYTHPHIIYILYAAKGTLNTFYHMHIDLFAVLQNNTYQVKEDRGGHSFIFHFIVCVCVLCFDQLSMSENSFR
jgi:hypothetical protein